MSEKTLINRGLRALSNCGKQLNRFHATAKKWEAQRAIKGFSRAMGELTQTYAMLLKEKASAQGKEGE